MAFLDSLKQDALSVLHATANALHAQLANTLSQAGHAVTESDHVDTLVKTAQAAATGAAKATVASTTAPNYADAALATFTHSMTAALIQFAQQHLPAKFQGIANDAAAAVNDATGKAKPSALIDDALKVVEAAVDVIAPSAAPIAAVVEPFIEEAVSAALPDLPQESEPIPGPAMNTQGV